MPDVDKPATPRNLGYADAPHVSPVTPSEDARTVLINRISWGAVLAGVVVGLVVQLILNLIGIGIGAATLNPGTANNPSASSFSIVAALWFAVAGILGALAGGFTAGRLSGQPKESTAGWHGLTTWAFTTLVVFFLLSSSVGAIVGGAYRGLASVVGTAATTTAQTVAPSLTAASDPFGSVEQSIRRAGNDPAAVKEAAVSSLKALLTGDAQQVDQARDQAAQAIAKAQDIPIEQARAQVQQYEAQYKQAVERAKQQAVETADTAARVVSRGALLGAITLLLGAIAGWMGGRMSSVNPTVTGGLFR